MDQTTTPTYKYWFWAGALLFVVSLFLPVYYQDIMGSFVSEPLGIQVWYESITFDGVGVSMVFSFVFALFNLVQIVYLAPKHDGWMIKGTLPEIFIAIAFISLPCCIAYKLLFYTDLLETGHFDMYYMLREGTYVYLAGYIATGIGMVQLRKHARVEETHIEVV